MVLSTHVERSNPHDPEYDPYDTESEDDDIAAQARNALKFGGADTPMFTGSKAAWEFAGGEQGDEWGFHEGRRSMRERYKEGAEAAGERESPIAQAARIEQQKQAQARQYQTQLLSQLQQRAAGMGPASQGELMAQRQGALGAQSALGVAASQRGLSPGAALRAAREQQASGGIAAQQQQQMIRTQEQQQAQQVLGQLSGQIRGQDIGLATSQAGMEQQAGLANQATNLQQTAQNDQMVQFYTNMGMSLEQAQIQAQIAREQMLSDIVRAQYNAQAGIISTGLQTSAAQQAGMYGAAGTAAYGAASAYANSSSGG